MLYSHIYANTASKILPNKGFFSLSFFSSSFRTVLRSLRILQLPETIYRNLQFKRLLKPFHGI